MGSVHDAVLYIGMTNDLARRVAEHRAGEGKTFAAKYRCRKLLYFEHFREVRDAIEREKQLKRWARGKKLTLIASRNPAHTDLAFEVLGETGTEMSRLRST